jgi:hypothetical protein
MSHHGDAHACMQLTDHLADGIVHAVGDESTLSSLHSLSTDESCEGSSSDMLLDMTMQGCTLSSLAGSTALHVQKTPIQKHPNTLRLVCLLSTV